jgi:hypothetical protein
MSDPSRRARLLATKLAALMRDNGGPSAPRPGEFGAGAAALAGDEAWVLVEDDPARGLGPAVAWALRSGATRLHVLAGSATGLLARRAAAFRMPIEVWHVHERALLPAIAEPLAPPPPVPARHERFRAVIESGGAVPLVEHGVLVGEVGGLEVCRVIDDPHTGEARLEVGIGAHDREAFRLLHGQRPTIEALADVVAAIRPHRLPDAAGHPLNRLAAERALRARLVSSPHSIGATKVVPAQPPIARVNLKDAVPCVAVASLAGVEVAVVCSTGVDLDLIPYAADARLSTGLDDCLAVVRARDLLPVQAAISAALRRPVELVALDIDAPDAP